MASSHSHTAEPGTGSEALGGGVSGQEIIGNKWTSTVVREAKP